MTERLTSPPATGGAGVIFEYRVAGIMLSRLLRGAHVPVGTVLPLLRVGLQQRNAGYPLDDIVAHTLPREGCTVAPIIQIQVKKSLRIATQNEDAAFVKVIAAAIEVCLEHTAEVEAGAMLLGLAVGEDPKTVLPDLAHLTVIAREHASAELFRQQFRPGASNEARRGLHEKVSAAVGTAIASDDAAIIEHL